MDIEYIDIDYIVPNENQPRRFFDEDAMTDLTDSVKRNGIIQPLILEEYGSGYMIIAGERRWRAAMSAGLDRVPALVMKNLEDGRAQEIAIIENLQRENLSPVEEALAFKEFLEKMDNKQEDLAEILGKSRSYISNTMRLLLLPDNIINELKELKISAGHARAILSLKDKSRQNELSKAIQDENLNVREAEALAKKWNKKLENLSGTENKKEDREKRVDRLIMQDIERRLTSSLGARVNIKKRRDRRIIEIECSDENQLEILVDLLENHSDNKEGKEQ